MHKGQYKAIGTDSTGKFVFKTVSEDELDDMTGADDNICYLSLENLEKLESILQIGEREILAHLVTLADASREVLNPDGADRRDWEYFETELVRAEDLLEGFRRMSKGYKIVCYMRVDRIEGKPMDIDDAQAELENLALMQPENIYRIEPCEDDE